jgi:hypothetical protein
MREPVVVAPKFRSFSPNIFSQASESVTVKVIELTVVLEGTNSLEQTPSRRKETIHMVIV